MEQAVGACWEGVAEQAVSVLWTSPVCGGRERKGTRGSCQEDLVKTQTWNPVGKEEAGL